MKNSMRGWRDHWVIFHADLADLTEFSIIFRDLLRTLALADLAEIA